jgi:hypothetical protein
MITLPVRVQNHNIQSKFGLISVAGIVWRPGIRVWFFSWIGHINWYFYLLVHRFWCLEYYRHACTASYGMQLITVDSEPVPLRMCPMFLWLSSQGLLPEIHDRISSTSIKTRRSYSYEGRLLRVSLSIRGSESSSRISFYEFLWYLCILPSESCRSFSFASTYFLL